MNPLPMSYSFPSVSLVTFILCLAFPPHVCLKLSHPLSFMSLSTSVYLFLFFFFHTITLSMVSLYPLSRESVAPLHCAQRLLSYPYVFYFCLLALLLVISQQSLPNNQSAILLQISNVALSLSVNMICCGCSNSASPHDHVCLLCFILSEPSVLCVYSSLSPTPVHQCPCWSTCAQPCFTPMKR